jgi:hypothetical protein
MRADRQCVANTHLHTSKTESDLVEKVTKNEMLCMPSGENPGPEKWRQHIEIKLQRR